MPGGKLNFRQYDSRRLNNRAIMTRENKLVMFLICLALSAPGTATATAGEVIDIDSGAAIAETWMIATRSECAGFGHCNTFCVEVRAGKISGSTKIPLPWRRTSSSFVFEFYKPYFYDVTERFARPQMSRKRPDHIEPGLDEVSARISYLVKLAGRSSCFSASPGQRNKLIPFYKDLVEEAWRIAQLPEHKQDAQSICWYLYHASLNDPNSYSSPAGEDPNAMAFFKENEPRCLEKPDLSDRNRFFHAVKFHEASTISAMLSGTVDEAIRTRRLNPALITATLDGDEVMMRTLLSHTANPNASDSNHRPVILALLGSETLSRNRKMQLAELLFSFGADPNKSDIWGYSPFHRVSAGGENDIISLMLEYGAKISQRVSCNSCMDHGKAPIHFATNVQVAKSLIEAGADVNSVWGSGTTALHYVQNPELATLLIEKGANVNALHSNDWTPLMHSLQLYETSRYNSALAGKNKTIARLLVKNGARLDSKNGWGKEAFYYTSDEELKAELVLLAKEQRK